MKERVTFTQDFWQHGKFFFHAPTSYDEQVIAKKWNEDAIKVLAMYSQEITKVALLTADSAKTVLESLTTQLGIGVGKILQALRVAITGNASGPDLMITIEILGKEEVANRINHALHTIKTP